MRFAGVDLARNQSGVCVVEAQAIGRDAVRPVAWAHFTAENTFVSRRQVADRMGRWIAAFEPWVVVIEDYVPIAGQYVAFGTGEIGGLLRDRLFSARVVWVPAHPSRMHSFALANVPGKIERKSRIIKQYLTHEAEVQWGVRVEGKAAERQDKIDAFWLALMGWARWAMDKPPLTERELLAMQRWVTEVKVVSEDEWLKS